MSLSALNCYLLVSVLYLEPIADLENPNELA